MSFEDETNNISYFYYINLRYQHFNGNLREQLNGWGITALIGLIGTVFTLSEIKEIVDRLSIMELENEDDFDYKGEALAKMIEERIIRQISDTLKGKF